FLLGFAAPPVHSRSKTASAAGLLDNVGINFGRSRKIKNAIATEIFGGVEFGKTFCQPGVRILVTVVARAVKKIRGKFIPLGGIDRAALGNRLGSFSGCVAEGLVGHRRSRETDNRVTFTERIVGSEIE